MSAQSTRRARRPMLRVSLLILITASFVLGWLLTLGEAPPTLAETVQANPRENILPVPPPRPVPLSQTDRQSQGPPLTYREIEAAAPLISATSTPSPTRTPTTPPTLPPCPTLTPELLIVGEVTSPTDQLSQVVWVAIGNGDAVTITTVSGVFVATGHFSTFSPARVTVSLLPNTTHDLTVEARVRPPNCFYDGSGAYTLTTTRDYAGNPLRIVQTEMTPTLTPTASATICPVGTAEHMTVDPVTSPTDQLSQIVKVHLGYAEAVTITTVSGVFVWRSSSSPFSSPQVAVSLLPNTIHNLTVEGRVRRMGEPGGCTYGGYSLTTTWDREGKPLQIVQIQPAPTPAPACVPRSILRGSVTLEGRQSFEGSTVQSQPLGSGSYSHCSDQGITPNDGLFSLFSYADNGQLQVTADHPLYLPARRVVSLSNQPTVYLPPVRLLGGDTNDDGVINLADLALVGAHYSSSPPGDGRADIDANGRVDLLDLIVVASNYGRTESPWYPLVTPTPTLYCAEEQLTGVGCGPAKRAPLSITLRQPDVVKAGELFAVEARLVGGGAVAGVDLTLAFDPVRLSLVDRDRLMPGAQAELGQGWQGGQAFVAVNQGEGVQGTYRFAAARLDGRQKDQGDGAVVRVWFRAREAGPPRVELVA
ncbi:MAG: hypothetical protein KIT87_28245, partial [Anaerolineae bacterium]|nr:hypothetical protein [Anaerolineae bacterium]